MSKNAEGGRSKVGAALTGQLGVDLGEGELPILGLVLEGCQRGAGRGSGFFGRG